MLGICWVRSARGAAVKAVRVDARRRGVVLFSRVCCFHGAIFFVEFKSCRRCADNAVEAPSCCHLPGSLVDVLGCSSLEGYVGAAFQRIGKHQKKKWKKNVIEKSTCCLSQECDVTEKNGECAGRKTAGTCLLLVNE